MQSPRVSIGLPVYNGERYLAAALDALCSQTYTDLEIVVSDNASTDATQAVCREYAVRDPRIRYHRADRNGGLAWNFNRVVELAQGEYFKWAAYDDLCAPTFVERCVQRLDADPQAVWCHAWTCYVDSRGEPLAGFEPLGFLGNGHGLSRASARPSQRFYAVMAGPGEVYDMYGLMRMAALRQTGLHRPFYGADRILLAELSLLGRYAEVPEVLFFARRHPEQTVFGPRAGIERATSGRSNQRWFMPRRLRRVEWMLRLAWSAPLPAAERARCLLAVVRFAVNPGKWRRLAVDALRRMGVHVSVPEDAIRQAALAPPHGPNE